MCKGYTISFAGCKHIRRIVEQRCGNAIRMQSAHCEILVTKLERERYQLGSCADCLGTTGHPKTEESPSLCERSRRNEDASGSSSSMTRPEGGRADEEKERVESRPSVNIGGTRDGQEEPLSARGGQRLWRQHREDVDLAHDPESFYRTSQGSHRMERIEESPVSQGRDLREDEQCYSGSDEELSINIPETAVRETVDFSRWVRSRSVIDAAERPS